MTILAEGFSRIITLLSADTATGKLGSGTTAESETDTDLKTFISGLSFTPTATTANQFLEKTIEILTLTGNGNTITEAGLFDSDKLVSRSTFAGVAKNNTLEFRTRTRFFVK